MNGVWALSRHHYYYLVSRPRLTHLVIQLPFTYPILRRRSTTAKLYRIIIMANNTRYYYSLPTEAPERSRSGSRRPPLTPSTVSSPCLTTHVPMTSRRDSSGSSGSPTKASALLAKVVSSPTTPRGDTPHGSPMPSPESRMHQSPAYSSQRPAVSRTESDRYVRQYRQQGKQPPPTLTLMIPGLTWRRWLHQLPRF